MLLDLSSIGISGVWGAKVGGDDGVSSAVGLGKNWGCCVGLGENWGMRVG